MTVSRPLLFHLQVLCLTFSLTLSDQSFSKDKKPLKVFILAGQSNMQGHAEVRTFAHLGMDPKTAPLLKLMQNSEGKPTVCPNVWISSIGSSPKEKFGQLTVGYGPKGRDEKIGPEFLFGIRMHQLLEEPVLIIKTAWGGKSLHTDFRSPSAGAFRFTPQQLEQAEKRGGNIEQMKAEKVAATGRFYRMMIEHVHLVLTDIKRIYPDFDETMGYELSGFVWFQGWNDMVDGGVYPNRGQSDGYDAYTQTLVHLINDVRLEFKTPDLPFVIGVMGVNGPVAQYGPSEKRYASTHQNFRDAMAAPALMPQFKETVVAVQTEKFWDMQLKDLRMRDSKINRIVSKLQKDGQVTREQAQEKRNSLRAQEFSAAELEALTVGVSNAEYHYLGSAKIMAQIGHAFAEAVYAKMKN